MSYVKLLNLLNTFDVVDGAFNVVDGAFDVVDGAFNVMHVQDSFSWIYHYDYHI